MIVKKIVRLRDLRRFKLDVGTTGGQTFAAHAAPNSSLTRIRLDGFRGEIKIFVRPFI